MIGIRLKKFYHCKMVPTERPTLKEYEAPKEKWGNYHPLSGYVDTVVYGKSVQSRWRMVVDRFKDSGEYSVGDLLYLDGAEPTIDEGYENGDGANAIITAVNIGYRAITIEIDSVIPRV